MRGRSWDRRGICSAWPPPSAVSRHGQIVWFCLPPISPATKEVATHRIYRILTVTAIHITWGSPPPTPPMSPRSGQSKLWTQHGV